MQLFNHKFFHNIKMDNDIFLKRFIWNFSRYFVLHFIPRTKYSCFHHSPCKSYDKQFNEHLFAVFTYSLADLLSKLGGLGAAKEIHNIFLHNALRFPMSFFDTTLKGRILSRFSKEIDVIDDRLPRQLDNVVFFTFQV